MVRRYYKYTSAPNLIYFWTNNPPTPTQTDPGQSAGQDVNFFSPSANQMATGQTTTNSNSTTNPTVQVGSPATIPNTAPETQPTAQGLRTHSSATQKNATQFGIQTDTQYASYVVQVDGPQGGHPATDAKGTTTSYGAGGGYFTDQRLVDGQYIRDLQRGAIPYTDDKGYELMSPFPWGRWIDVNTAIKEFTERGWIKLPTDVSGNTTQDLSDLSIQQSTDAMLYAGLGTPTATGSSADQIINALSTKISNTVGGTFSSTSPDQNTITPDATVIVLQYPPGNTSPADSNLLQNSQPEDQLAGKLIANTQQSNQQVIDVLVSGSVAPTKTVQEALVTTTTQTPSGKVLTLVNGQPVPQDK